MITIVESQHQFDSLIESLSWDDAYIRELCFIPSLYEEDGTVTPISDGPVTRVLLALPNESSMGFEFLAFKSRSIWICSNQEIIPKGTIRRREAVISFQAFELECECLAYRHLDTQAVSFGSFYGKEVIYNREGDLVNDYKLDWRLKLDLAHSKHENKSLE